jgi:two-component system chemotaxis response regulator CheB
MMQAGGRGEAMGQGSRRSLRVLAADDSAVMRGVLRTVFELQASQGDVSLPPMELCGLMRDGVEALDAVRRLKPDVLVLDLEMPRMNGLEVLAELRKVAPDLPVIMCSAHTERGARSTLDALSLGAKDYVMKPGQQKDFASALDSLMEQLLPKIAALAGRVEVRAELRLPTRGGPLKESSASVEVVVIGVSTGGPSALETMLPLLPRDFPVPMLIVQHMPKLFTGALAERLQRLCSLAVKQAVGGETISAGGVWIAPGDMHMELEVSASRKSSTTIRLHQGPALNSCMPSADYLFRSAAEVFGCGTLAVVMTGMGSDGLEGARAVSRVGGTVLAQDEATSAVWGMPGRVAKEGLASALVALPLLAEAIAERVSRGRQRSSPISSGLTYSGAALGDSMRREVSYGVL